MRNVSITSIAIAGKLKTHTSELNSQVSNYKVNTHVIKLNAHVSAC